MSGKRITQADVAAKCGVNRATVSLALKEHPSIPLTTRTRVQAMARQLGYVPDPMLSALAAYRGRLRPSSFHGTLGWISRDDRTYDWRAIRHFVDYFDGATAAAKRHGFNLETFNLSTTPRSAERVGEILRARNVGGVLLCPQPVSNATLALPWARLSAVTFGYTLAEPRLNTVTATQFRGTVATMRQLYARGYRRIGFVFQEDHNRRTDENYLGGFLSARFMAGPQEEIPPLFIERYQHVEEVVRWIRKHRPDAVVTGDFRFIDRAKQAGLELPPRLGLACPLLPDTRGSLAGVCEDCFHIGEVAVDLVVAMMHRGERGVPAQPQRVHVEGQWFEGTSLRPLPATVKEPA